MAKNYIIKDNWKIIEKGFDASLNQISESIFSLGNGRMGQRGNFEETYTGQSLQGNYMAGIYYPDKTRVGWWKNGYPEYFAKVLNAANWMGLRITIAGQILDLAKVEVLHFYRELNMQEGYLKRTTVVRFSDGKEVGLTAIRLYSIVDDAAAAYRYEMTALNFSEVVQIDTFIDGDVRNQDANYDENFWEEIAVKQNAPFSFLTLRTKKTAFDVCTGTYVKVSVDGYLTNTSPVDIRKEKCIGLRYLLPLKEGATMRIDKIATNLSSENYAKNELLPHAEKYLKSLSRKGFDQMKKEQSGAWAKKWENSDIVIEGDVAAQQAIRFNIFQLNQTYTGEDPRLNIGPKGFTGEKYGGSTYWDTEAYCLPFYLSTAAENVSRNLLMYRYRHLPKAIENAAKLGFTGGAALYPMVTMNGEECHNEWEITFEEIHRNAAIAFAIYRYVQYTGDEKYVAQYGLEVLIAIARFWAQRINWSAEKEKYVMLGVTGPNEYENNVNNNWYTNTMAVWCLQYTLEALQQVQETDELNYHSILARTHFDVENETPLWKNIIQNMYLPEDKQKGIFLQQDGYLDKEQTLVKDLPAKDLPLNQKWSWDRILRSCFIKQADVLQGFYFLQDRFDADTLRRNFDFYEARTVHESSLSPCVHSILAAKLGDAERAYAFYLRTARLDLDDYNNDSDDGLHITSMAGTWMSVVEGFGGMRTHDGYISFNPLMPKEWNRFSFRVGWRKTIVKITVSEFSVQISHISGPEILIEVYSRKHLLAEASSHIWNN